MGACLPSPALRRADGEPPPVASSPPHSAAGTGGEDENDGERAVRRFYALLHESPQSVSQCFSPDAEVRDGFGGVHRGRVAVEAWFSMWAGAFPDGVRISLERMAGGGGGVVVAEGALFGRHEGELEVPASHAGGRAVVFPGTGREFSGVRFCDVFRMGPDGQFLALACYGDAVFNVLTALRLSVPVPRMSASSSPSQLGSLMDRLKQHLVTVEAVAAVGATLQSEIGHAEMPDSSIAERCRRITHLMCEDSLAKVDMEGKAMLHSLIHAHLTMSAALLENPLPPPGWHFTETHVIQAVGRFSTTTVKCLLQDVVPAHPALGQRLAQTGCVFLDVGSGASWISIAMASQFPMLTAVGLDTHDAALAVAGSNIAASGVQDRVVAIKVDAADSAQFAQWHDRVSLVWLPCSYLNPDQLESCMLANMLTCLEPGGWLVAGLVVDRSGNPLNDAVTQLRVARHGGKAWTPEELMHTMLDVGFVEVASVDTSAPDLSFVVGRKAPSQQPEPPPHAGHREAGSVHEMWATTTAATTITTS